MGTNGCQNLANGIALGCYKLFGLPVYVINQTEPCLSLKQAVRAYTDKYLT